jgi:hypothetical protein
MKLVLALMATLALTACGKQSQEFIKHHPQSEIVHVDLAVCYAVQDEMRKNVQARVQRNESSISAFGTFWDFNSKGQGVKTHCFSANDRSYRRGNTQSYVEILDGSVIKSELARIDAQRAKFKQDNEQAKERAKGLL